MADEAKLLSAFEALVVQHAVKRDCGEELGPFCYQYLLQALQFWVHLIDLLSILLRCNGFAGIQRAVVDQTGSRPPMTMTFLWCKFGFGKCFGASSQSLPVVHFLLHVTI